MILVAGAVAYLILAKPAQDYLGGTQGEPATTTTPSNLTNNGALQWLNPTTYYNIGYDAGYTSGTWLRSWFT